MGGVVAARARGLVGTRFRAQGREAGAGLDCVGVAVLALGVPVEAVRRDYALRGGSPGDVAAALPALGLVPVADARAGDLLLLATGPGQLHLAVRTEGGFVHADAGLRRVVERPGEPPWPLLGAWRLVEGDKAWRR